MMSNPGDADAEPIVSVQQLADHIAKGGKPKAEYRIGTEHEKFGFFVADRHPPPYEPGGIHAVLDGLTEAGAWEPILEKGLPIGLKGAGAHRGASVSLEPAGQLELSGGMLETLHETEAELEAHYAALRSVAKTLGLGFAPVGHHPTMSRAEMPWMPKGRYAIMRRYMPLVGQFGLDMMARTCTVQVNLDYSSEADMARKLRVSLALQPVATALFANSPFIEGKPSGYLSSRARVWTDVDNQRSGMPPLMFEEGFGFERYVNWLLDVPMYFVLRDNHYHDVAGQSFRQYMTHGLPDLPGVRATMGDFEDHMTTAFTDVRVKRFLEMRGADAGSTAMMVAQSALWTGLFYDEAALAAADALVRRRPWQDYITLRGEVPRLALDSPFAHGVARDLARDMVAIATDGLKARARKDVNGADERRLLAPLLPMLEGGPTQAEAWLSRFNHVWNGDASRMLTEADIV
jgi:glutamate--cysteine ligase